MKKAFIGDIIINEKIFLAIDIRSNKLLSNFLTEKVPGDYRNFLTEFGLGTFNSYVQLIEPYVEQAFSSEYVVIATSNDGFQLVSMADGKNKIVCLRDRHSGECDKIGENLSDAINWMALGGRGHIWDEVYFIPEGSQYMAWSRRNPSYDIDWFVKELDGLNPKKSFRRDYNHVFWWQDEQLILELSGYYCTVDGGDKCAGLIEFSINFNPSRLDLKSPLLIGLKQIFSKIDIN